MIISFLMVGTYFLLNSKTAGCTFDSVWPGHACTCVDLQGLTVTGAHFGRDQICTQVEVSFMSFGHQPKSRQVE